jgi:hypothetical protein
MIHVYSRHILPSVSVWGNYRNVVDTKSSPSQFIERGFGVFVARKDTHGSFIF